MRKAWPAPSAWQRKHGPAACVPCRRQLSRRQRPRTPPRTPPPTTPSTAIASPCQSAHGPAPASGGARPPCAPPRARAPSSRTRPPPAASRRSCARAAGGARCVWPVVSSATVSSQSPTVPQSPCHSQSVARRQDSAARGRCCPRAPSQRPAHATNCPARRWLRPAISMRWLPSMPVRVHKAELRVVADDRHRLRLVRGEALADRRRVVVRAAGGLAALEEAGGHHLLGAVVHEHAASGGGEGRGRKAHGGWQEAVAGSSRRLGKRSVRQELCGHASSQPLNPVSTAMAASH